MEGESKPIGTTPNHPIWSVDREAFVRADSLTVGERLQTLNGITTVTKISPRGPPEPVYNLEVQVKHTYFVADIGVLVHNGKDCGVGDIADDANVVRGGSKSGGGAASPEGIRGGSGVTIDANGKAHGVSVQAGNKSIEELSSKLRNGKVSISTAGRIREVGGTIDPKPRFPGDNHAEIGNIFPETLSDLLNEILNPAK